VREKGTLSLVTNMAKKQNKKQFPKLLVVIVIAACVGLIFLLLFESTKNVYQQSYHYSTKNNQVNSYTSHDLNISFDYLENWYITDKDFSILLTNYKHNLNSNYRPNENEIEITISEGLKCQVALDEQVVIGGCFGEGNWVPTKILEKKTKKLSSGMLYTYVVKHPNGLQQTRYFLQKGDKMLQISKEPDLSQFEKEFEDIISSIKFL
jgi:hypothetical protein